MVIAESDEPNGPVSIIGVGESASDGLRKGVRLLATPSTCAQFLPNVDDFAVDPRPPAYRTLELRADGSLLTEVVWVQQYSGGSSRSACSAA